MPDLPEFIVLFLFRMVTRLGYRMRVEGQENIPPRGPAVLICNHVSFVDWLIVAAAAKRPVRFVIDHSFVKGSVLKWIFRQAQVIPIAGGKENPGRLEEAYRQIAAALGRGELVCIFPEGQITFDGKLSAFKPGVIKIVRRTPVPVVPMALRGLWGSFFSRESGRAMGRWPRRFRSPIELRVGAPVPPEQAKLAELEQRVRELRGAGEPG